MMEDQELNERLDRYAKGTLSGEELAELREKMDGNSALRKKAEQHMLLVRGISQYGKRAALKRLLDQVPLENGAEAEKKNPGLLLIPKTRFRKYWPVAAVAASVALLSVFGTMLVTQMYATKQTARYEQLVRHVQQQMKKSENRIIAGIEQKNKKESPRPNQYAGTGFLVSTNGYVITSHHVVRGADSVYIENEVFGSLKATVVHSDVANDVSVLRIESTDFKAPKVLPYMISSTEASLGEEVYTLGFPREDVVFGEGSISALSGYRQNPNAYQVSVPVNPGNSGGPLFNSKGDLVGIISGLQTETSGAAFAVKSSVLLDVVKNLPADSLHSPLVLPKQNALKSFPKVEQVRKWKDNVFIVRVYNNK